MAILIDPEEDYISPEDRVEAGIELLDSRLGPTWHTEIDAEALNMFSSYFCVLGQLYGDYQSGLDALDVGGPDIDQWAWKHGFEAIGQPNIGERRSAEVLTQLWKNEVLKRKGN